MLRSFIKKNCKLVIEKVLKSSYSWFSRRIWVLQRPMLSPALFNTLINSLGFITGDVMKTSYI